MGRLTLAAALALLCAPDLVGAQPVNDECAGATVVGVLPFTDTVDTTAATTVVGDPDIECDGDALGQGDGSVWYRYTSPDGGSLEVDTFGSDYETFLVAWRGSCGAFGPVAACNANDYETGYPARSRVVVTMAPGETMYLEVLTLDVSGGNLVVNVQETSAFRVTDEDIYTGEFPDVAAGEDGTFLVVWEQEDYSIMGRRYCDTGVPVGAPFLVSDTLSFSYTPRVARTGSEFVVVWSRDGDELYGRRITGSGVPIGPVFEVTDSQVAYYWETEVAGDASGFVVTWAQYDDGDDFGVVARRFDTSGMPRGPEFAVNTYTTGRQKRPSVASDAAGNSVIVWESLSGQDGSGDGIFGQRFDATGLPVGPEFQANATTTDDQQYPVVSADPSGGFVVAWQDLSSSVCGYRCVVARRFDATAAPLSGDFEVSPAGAEPPPYYGSIDAGHSADGDFIVSWADESDFPRARAFAADGTPQGPALQMAYLDDDYQRWSRIGVADDGDFQVVWEWAPSGSSYKVMGRAVADAPSCPAPTGCPASPRSGCKMPTQEFKGRLAIKDESTDTGDAIVWKWVKGDETTAAEIGDPLVSDTVSFCLYDGGGTLLTEALVEPGGTCGTRPCWKGLGTPPGSKGYRYKNGPSNDDGAQKLVAKPGLQGKAKTIFKGHGENLTMPALPVTLPLTAQLASTTGTCWSAEFGSEGLLKNEPGVFAGKASGPASPSGAFVH